MQMFAELKKQGDTKYSNPRSLADAIVEVKMTVRALTRR